MNIGAINADVVQLMIRVAGKLLQNSPVGAASAKEAWEGEYFHEGLDCVIQLANECVGVYDLVSAVNLRSSRNYSIVRW